MILPVIRPPALTLVASRWRPDLIEVPFGEDQASADEDAGVFSEEVVGASRVGAPARWLPEQALRESAKTTAPAENPFIAS